MRPADIEAAVAVGRALPSWFTENGVLEIMTDLPHERGAVAVLDGAGLDGEVVGFIAWFSYMRIARIGWLGVLTPHHRRGIGRRLLEFAEERLRASGALELRVDTLGDSVEYEPYARTRAFYRGCGFGDFKRVMSDNPECPENLTLSKSLRPDS